MQRNVNKNPSLRNFCSLQSTVSSEIVEEKKEEEEEAMDLKRPIPKLDILLKRGRYSELFE